MMKSLIFLPLSTAAVFLVGLCVVYAGTIDYVGTKDEKKKNPELGRVKWLRDFSEIQARSKKEKKPVFMLFQEVPG